MPDYTGYLPPYKFDPMDFETNTRGSNAAGGTMYKFDPMDFETSIRISTI